MKIGKYEIDNEVFTITIGVFLIIVILSVILNTSVIDSANKANQITVFYSKPYVKGINQTEYLVTVRVMVSTPSTNYVYIIPFLANSSGYPALRFQGFINEVFYPDNVGYVNLTGYNVTTKVLYNIQIVYKQGPFMTTNAFAYIVQTGESFNVTFITNKSYVPTIWVAEPPLSSASNAFYVPTEIIIPINGTPYTLPT